MFRIAGILMVATILVAACGDTTGPLVDPSGSPTATGGPTAAPTAEPPTDAPSVGPSAEPTPEPVVTPGSTPTPGTSPDVSLDPNASPTPTPEAACSGSDANRDFFASAAGVMSWDVYCAVLPSGWFVQTGQYKRAGGGFLEISYAGSGGRTFALREGAFCGDPGGCVPAGPEVGAGMFGDLEGTVIAAADGSWAIVVDKGASPSWLATGSGIDEPTFRALAAAIHLVVP